MGRFSNKVRYGRRWFVLLSAIGALALVSAGVWYAIEKLVVYDIPTEAIAFNEIKPGSATTVVDVHGQPLHYLYGDKLILYRPTAQISKHLAEFVVFLEDAKFFMHEGFDVEEIKNSLEKNLEKGKVRRGASTITQQLAKNMFLDQKRSYTRKLFEVPWTIRLEKDLSKRQILELYLNVIEWGPGIHGAEAAARHYFDRSAGELTAGQAMYLALIIPNPIRFDVFAHPGALKSLETKRQWLVERLVDEKRIAPEQREEYMTMPFGLVNPDSRNRRYPMSHEGRYAGNRFKWPANSLRGLIEKSAGKIRAAAGSKRPINLSVDRDAQSEVDALAETADPGELQDRFLLFYDGSSIRALRFVKRGRTLSSPPDRFRVEAVTDLPWKSLVL